MSHLRHLCLSVDEPQEGNYRWVVFESSKPGLPWRNIEEGAGFHEWLDAWNAGSDALLALVKDGRYGPRDGGRADAP